jgi:hypothetical protein
LDFGVKQEDDDDEQFGFSGMPHSAPVTRFGSPSTKLGSSIFGTESMFDMESVDVEHGGSDGSSAVFGNASDYFVPRDKAHGHGHGHAGDHHHGVGPFPVHLPRIPLPPLSMSAAMPPIPGFSFPPISHNMMHVPPRPISRGASGRKGDEISPRSFESGTTVSAHRLSSHRGGGGFVEIKQEIPPPPPHPGMSQIKVPIIAAVKDDGSASSGSSSPSSHTLSTIGIPGLPSHLLPMGDVPPPPGGDTMPPHKRQRRSEVTSQTLYDVAGLQPPPQPQSAYTPYGASSFSMLIDPSTTSAIRGGTRVEFLPYHSAAALLQPHMIAGYHSGMQHQFVGGHALSAHGRYPYAAYAATSTVKAKKRRKGSSARSMDREDLTFVRYLFEDTNNMRNIEDLSARFEITDETTGPNAKGFQRGGRRTAKEGAITVTNFAKKPPTEHAAYARIRVWKDDRGRQFYDCVCNARKPVQDLNKIKKHALSHDQGRFQCDICGKVFGKNHLQLNAHKKTHKTKRRRSTMESTSVPDTHSHVVEHSYHPPFPITMPPVSMSGASSSSSESTMRMPEASSSSSIPHSF